MTDPFSIAVGVAGLASLADTVVTRGFRYVKAVKGCDEDVERLISETSALGSLLGRLEQEAEEYEDKNDYHRDEDGNALGTMQYVYNCQKTLKTIEQIFGRFDREIEDRKDPKAPNTTSQYQHEAGEMKHKPSKLSTIIQVALKWPLSKGDTMELIEQVERHKSTCILALSSDQRSNIRKILGQQEVTSGALAEIQADARKTLALTEAQEEGKEVQRLFQWLSSYDPSTNHQTARGLHHEGTGQWVFDLPGFTEWIGKTNSGLWIYGIPGAGKTILSSLVIERVFAMKGYGVAYYYCDYKSAVSQDPLNVLGSLATQLVKQNAKALREVQDFYKLHHPERLPPKRPNEESLGRLIQRISIYFSDVTLVIDGLDECGAAAGIDRSALVGVLSRLHDEKVGSIRTMIASREEVDIGETLTSFTPISIAANSADLELYVAAEVSRRSRKLRFRDKGLRIEIVETLIKGACGMFMWCKCQLDYLCTLPNDTERREALNHLPPDLPATYIRILERLERDYSPQTTELIRKTFKWLALQREDIRDNFNLTLPGLSHAISLGKGATLDYDRIPDEMDIVDWCSSLVRLNKKTNRLELSHFTVKEFLLEEPQRISSEIARQYLVDPEADMAYLAETCLLYLSLEDFDETQVIMEQRAWKEFTMHYAFYEHAALKLADYLAFVGLDPVDCPACRRLFSMKIPGMLATWNSFLNVRGPIHLQQAIAGNESWLVQSVHGPWTALQLSTALLLSATTSRLLKEGATPNETDDFPASPLHLCMGHPTTTYQLIERGLPSVDGGVTGGGLSQYTIAEQRSRRFSIARNLLLAGAKANALSQIGYPLSAGNFSQLTPFCAAILHLHEDICRLLVDSGGTWSPTSDDVGVNHSKLYSVLDRVGGKDKALPRFNQILDLLLCLPELRDHLLKFMGGRDYGFAEYDQPWSLDGGDFAKATQALLTAAALGKRTAVRLALLKGADVEARNGTGQSALMIATDRENSAVISELLAKGADVHSLCQSGDSPFTLALRRGPPENARRLFGDHVDLELSNERKVRSFRSACVCGNNELLAFVVGQGLQLPANEEPLVFSSKTPMMDQMILKTAHEYGLLSLEEIRRTFQKAWREGASKLLELLLSFESVSAIGREFEVPKLDVGNHEAFMVLIKHDFFEAEQRHKLRDEARRIFCNAVELLLLSQEELFDSMDIDGNYPVHRACLLSSGDLLEYMLKEGTDVNSRNVYYQCPIHFASGNPDNTDLMEILIRSGADVNAADDKGQTPLYYVFGFISNFVDRAKRCSMLIKAGADPNVARDKDKSTVLHAAAELNDRESVKLLLRCNANPEIYNGGGYTALHAAAAFGSVQIVAAFVEYIGNSSAVNCLNQDLSTPLHCAAAAAQEPLCKLLIGTGADVKATNTVGQTALHTTVSTDNDSVDKKSIIRLLLQAGAQIEARDNSGFTPLHLAAKVGKFRAIEALLQRGASTSSRDYLGLTALLSAAAAGCDEIMLLLVQNGADVNASNYGGASCLHLAAAGNHRTALRLLLKLKARVNATDNSGATALDFAKASKFNGAQIILNHAGAKAGKDLGFLVASSPIWPAVAAGDNAILQSLMDEGHIIDLREKKTGQTPVHLAASVGKIDTINFLSGKGGDIFAKNAWGETALHYAVRSMSIQTIDHLIGKGLDPNVEDYSGSRPLHIACSLGAEQIVSKFLSMKETQDNLINSSSSNYGTPVWAASSSGNVSIVRELVEAGASVETSRSWMGPPLFAACANGHRDVVKYLLSKGASTVPEGTRFRTAMEMADAYGQFEIVEIFKEADAAKEAKGNSVEKDLEDGC